MSNYNKKFTAGCLYDVYGRKARYWGADSNNNHRRILIFFEVRTGCCIEVPSNEIANITKL